MFELSDTVLTIILFALFFILGVGIGISTVENFPKKFLEKTPYCAYNAVARRINELEAEKEETYYRKQSFTLSRMDANRERIKEIDKEIQYLKRWQRDHV